MAQWAWLLQYGVTGALALLLGALLSHSHLFQSAPLGTRGVTAADVVRFLGDAAALLLIWLAARRAARSLAEDGGWRSLVRHTLTPLATFVVLALGYGVPLFVLRPFMNPATMTAYGWLFVLAILAAALWLALAAYHHAGALVGIGSTLARSLPRDVPARREVTAPPPRCPQCGTAIAPTATTCERCGHRLAA